ncbi:DDE superfamily endonuclease [Methylorubrum salsuginis]|uniref:DDE superfamily endonuclease n=1 Tax=Methylorubrum salsuginis TaxID=414703 RepID=A0A1I4M9F0_9HYPH|nr:DDE superfamily endonuclease [Methylorubrum salsuginis]
MRFRAYVTDTLAPVLKPGDIVILDNLNVHKVAGVREAIEAVGAQTPHPKAIHTCSNST